jgi:hypothetical protein
MMMNHVNTLNKHGTSSFSVSGEIAGMRAVDETWWMDEHHNF